MKCRETTIELNAYLDGELGALERRIVEEHISGCASCERELEALDRTRGFLRSGLQLLAAEAVPSPMAWSRLQAGIAAESVGSSRVSKARVLQQGRRSAAGRRWRAVSLGATALLLALCIVAAVPSARSAAGDFLASLFNWYRFTPMEAGYLPEGLDSAPVYQVGMAEIPSGGGAEGGGQEGSQEFQTEQSLYRGGKWFVLIKSTSDTDTPLPDGQATEVNGDDAVLVTGLSGTEPPPEQLVIDVGPSVTTDPRYTVDYRDAVALTWVHDGTRIEVLSNLPAEEIRKIAAGLVVSHIDEVSP
jgi:hypothetical protein